MNRTFWKDKKVFLTGHTGFKGSWLTFWLNLLEAEVSGYSLEPNTSPNLFSILKIDNKSDSTFGNILDKNKLKAKINDFKPDIIFHMAAQPLVRESYSDPETTYQTNVMGTLNLLEILRDLNETKVFINITTDKCYENKEWLWSYRENEPLGGYDPYSSSKACSELLTASYRDSFFKKNDSYTKAIATARAGNVIGGGDWSSDRLLPDFFRAISKKEQVIIRNPNAIRPWQHVLCPLHGYLLLAEKMFNNVNDYSNAWNFGPSEEDARNVQWIINKLYTLAKLNNNYNLDRSSNQPHEATYLKLDCSKSRSMLNWNPHIKLDDALEMIHDWFQAFYNNDDMELVTKNQIDYFENIVKENS